MLSFPRAVSASLSCNCCRQAIIRSFTAQLHSSSLSRSYPPWASRPFTSTSTPRKDAGFEVLKRKEDRTLTSSNTSAETETPASETSKPAKPSPHQAPIPWYLQPQHSPPLAPSNPQPLIPQLPPKSPPLLEILLTHISLNLGLDDLLLLDLRHLDPPPALGSNLIMILGTARSEKHLHVSADRFCRWLRREHNLRANAAGLLGRNELKIKMRRKAKRMKMLANVGVLDADASANIDDGIRTGWICCTLGRVRAHPDDVNVPGAEKENFVGFREVSGGVNVVVQMFTEEKRAEIDLETLWGGIVRTSERENRRVDKELMEEGEEDGDREIVPQTSRPFVYRPPGDVPGSSSANQPLKFYKPKSTVGDPFPTTSNSNSNSARQLRRLHTVCL
ncbi:hypothetical protein CC78DRAFT_529755 [Lojkania enalia]|uniref:ATPase synthesis protein 25 n=1 Tax=Lojkania enalia TaxID=147567 RepID=A0A9P4KGM8_9PLEO|nr:hypothetical protein CC78DRAFT_529755 [Didymosphaeria enalia]